MALRAEWRIILTTLFESARWIGEATVGEYGCRWLRVPATRTTSAHRALRVRAFWSVLDFSGIHGTAVLFRAIDFAASRCRGALYTVLLRRQTQINVQRAGFFVNDGQDLIGIAGDQF